MPDFLARRPIDGVDPAIGTAEIHPLGRHRRRRIDSAVGIEGPLDTAIGGVERPNLAVPAANVHRAVGVGGRGLNIAVGLDLPVDLARLDIEGVEPPLVGTEEDLFATHDGRGIRTLAQSLGPARRIRLGHLDAAVATVVLRAGAEHGPVAFARRATAEQGHNDSRRPYRVHQSSRHVPTLPLVCDSVQAANIHVRPRWQKRSRRCIKEIPRELRLFHEPRTVAHSRSCRPSPRPPRRVRGPPRARRDRPPRPPVPRASPA